MRRQSHHVALCLAVATLDSLLHAAENNIASAAKMPVNSIDLFTGMESGDLQVKLIPKNDREASLLITNKTNAAAQRGVARCFRRRADSSAGGGGWRKPKPHYDQQ
jgi:hypothetical protein